MGKTKTLTQLAVLIFLVSAMGYMSVALIALVKSTHLFTNTSVAFHTTEIEKSQPIPEGKYEVYQKGNLIKKFLTYEEAKAYALQYDHTFVKEKGTIRWLWDNYPQYNVFVKSDDYVEFSTFLEALNYAKKQDRAFVYYRKNNSLVWSTADTAKDAFMIKNVPLILQYPELPRGCEVTSLAMLLNYHGIRADKMKLADEVKKDPTQYEVKSGRIHFGNPNTGFVGEMKSLNTQGLGVYHAPIKELLDQYTNNEGFDLTGVAFSDLEYYISSGLPVWVITNVTFAELPKSSFVTWQTPTGKIDITTKEHSVVITGYDKNHVYINDPLYSNENRSVPKADFIKAWEQMGKQAVIVMP